MPGLSTRTRVLECPASQKTCPLAPRHSFSVVESVLSFLLVACPHVAFSTDQPLVPMTEALHRTTPSSCFLSSCHALHVDQQQLWQSEGVVIVRKVGQTLKEVTFPWQEVRWPCPSQQAVGEASWGCPVGWDRLGPPIQVITYPTGIDIPVPGYL